MSGAAEKYDAESEAAAEVLSGGGDVGALMRALNWSKTLAGPVERWPQSLRTSVSICLDSRFPILVWWGPDLVMFYNDAYRSILGKSKHPRALGAAGAQIWPEIWHIVGPMLRGVLEKGQATYSPDLLLMLERNGFPEECYFTFSYSPIRSEAGRAGGVFTAVTETTGRVVGERRLRTLRDLASHAAGCKTVEEACRAAMSTLSDNAADMPFAMLYLLSDDEMEARLVAASHVASDSPAHAPVVHLNGDANRAAWPLAAVLQSGKTLVVEGLESKFGAMPRGPWSRGADRAVVLPLSAPGQERQAGLLIAALSPARAWDGEYQDFLDLVAGHVTTAIANARAQEEQRRRAEALMEIDRAKTAFFSNVSHEFRTPLTLMLGPLQDIIAQQHGAIPDRAARELSVVHRNSLRLLKLVNALLDFSRLEAGRVLASYEPMDLGAFTADLAGLFRSAIERAGMKLIVSCGPIREPVFVDRDAWEKVVLNLISNAFKYTLEGQITVTLTQVGGKVELRVQDTGVGIPAGEIPRLFQRFHRVEGSRGRTHEGTGIGLALVQELVKLHGGNVRVESVPGKGSTFIVALPLGTAHLPPERIQSAKTAGTTSGDANPYVEEALGWLPAGGDGDDNPANELVASADGSELAHRYAATRTARVILADDNSDMRDYVLRLLRPFWRVEAVADGQAALDAARRSPPDLIVADVMMPKLDGFALLRALRADPALTSIPVIMLSARAGEEATVEGMQAGAADYLVKPFSRRELIARVGAVLEISRARQDGQVQETEIARLNADLKHRITEFEALLNVLPIGIAVAHDRECRNIRINPAFAKMLRLGTSKNASLTAPPDQRPDHFRCIDDAGVEIPSADLPMQVAAREGRAVENVEFDVVHADRRRIRLLEHVAPLFDERGNPRGAVGAFLDITERKKAEARDRFLVELDDATRKLTDPDAIMASACELLGKHLGVDRCTYGEMHADEDTFDIPYDYTRGVASMTGRYKLEQFGQAAQLYRQGKPLVVDDVETHGPLLANLASYRAASIRAIVGFPLHKGGKLVSAMGVHQKNARHWMPDEIELVRLVTNRCWEILERARVARDLRQSEEQFRVMANSIPQLSWMARPDGWIFWYNDRWYQYTGTTPEAMMGWGWEKVHDPAELPRVRERWAAAVASGEAWEDTFPLRRHDGQMRRHLSRAMPLRDAQGRVALWFGTNTDISEREKLEQRFRTSADSAPVLIWIADTTKACIWFNKPWLDFVGRSMEQEVRDGWIDAVHPEDLERCRQTYNRNFDDRKPFRMEYRLRRHDGAWRWVIDQGTPLYEGPGAAFSGYIGSCIDITDRKQVEQELAEARDRLELSVDAAELGTFFCPMPLGEIVWNVRCKEHFFLPPDAKVDFELFYSILHPDDRQRTRQAVERAVFAHEGYDVQYRTVAPDGRTRWIRAKGRAYFDAAGNPVRFDGVTIDITDIKELDEERIRLLDAERAARVEAERVSRMKDEFLATLSHELRTPLNAILGWSQLLRHADRTGEDYEQGMEAIERNARSQTQLIEDLLDMSRIISGKVRLDVRRVGLAGVVEAALGTVAPAAQAKGVRIEKVLDQSAGSVFGDPNRLQQVVWNLLSNAVKFTPGGGKVQIVLERVESHLEVRVTDTGKGIRPDFLPYVFERFRQEDASTTRKHGGLGLGLSIVKHLVELHGGSVRAESAGDGQGATFTIALPLLAVKQASDAGEREHPAVPRSAPANFDPPSLREIKVLIVDDDRDAREVIARMLQGSGATILTASSAPLGLEIIQREMPHVLVSDIGMPGMDGYELIRKLRALPPEQGGHTPAVALTAFARLEDRRRTLVAGFQMHVAKPVEPSELLAVVASLAGRFGTEKSSSTRDQPDRGGRKPL